MTIFKERIDEEYITTSEAKEILVEIEAERAEDESRELVEELAELEPIDVPTAIKIADLLPEDRTELRSVFAQERYSLDGDELDDVLDVVAKYA